MKRGCGCGGRGGHGGNAAAGGGLASPDSRMSSRTSTTRELTYGKKKYIYVYSRQQSSWALSPSFMTSLSMSVYFFL